MSFSMIVAGIGLFAPSAPAPASPATCALLQAAYMAAMDDSETAYPASIAPARQELMQLDQFVPKYREAMELAPGEFEDLEASQKRGKQGGFVPECAWKGKATSLGKEEGGTPTSFSRPILSSDNRLALVEVSYSQGISAHGSLCILRFAAVGWRGRCLPSWSIR
jgi:hypothetical protein